MATLALTDGGLETVLISEYGFDLPCFAAFPLLDSREGRDALRRYYEPFLDLADEKGMPFSLDTATWRANPDWGEQLGYDRGRLAEVNREAVRFARELARGRADVTISGALGPRGDGYVVGERMTTAQAEEYHAWQIAALADADRIAVLTLTYPEEAAGVARAAAAAGLPSAIGFTVETDGRLPSGDGLREAIAYVDAETDAAPAFFIVNCAHPTHFAGILDDEAGPWLERIGGLRVNASPLSHAELDEAEEVTGDDPAVLAGHHDVLRDRLPAVVLLGGCCGTGHDHVKAIAESWTSP